MKKSITVLLLTILFGISNAQKIDQKEKISQIIQTTKNISSGNPASEKEYAKNTLKYIAEEIDWQTLYSTEQWSDIISSWVYLNTSILLDFYVFKDDFKTISNKITDPIQYTDFVGKMAYFLTKQNKKDYINFFAPLVRASGKIEKYDGVLASYIKGTPGTYAPDLIIKEQDKNTILKSKELATGNYTQTLLIFYASDCAHCQLLFQNLPDHLENIKAKGVRLISLSADRNEKEFNDKAKTFLWKDVFCDYEGIKGTNFQNYAIIGTPTMFILDHDGKIILRTSSLEEVLKQINK
jgi:peroxiredoxin